MSHNAIILFYNFFTMNGQIVIQRAMNDYYQYHREMASRPKTIKWHKGVHKYFIKNTGIQYLQDIDKPLIKSFISQLFNKGVDPQSIKTFISSIRAFYRYCVAEEYVEDTGLWRKIKLPQMDKKPPKTIDEESFAKIKKAVLNYNAYLSHFEALRTKTIFFCFMYTGMRKSEILNILTKNVNLDSGCILVENTKTRNYREVPIHMELDFILREYMSFMEDKGYNNEYLFFNIDPHKPLPEITLRRMKKKIQNYAIKRYGSKAFTWHRYRHTLATDLVLGGANIKDVQDILGHTNIQTTINIPEFRTS